MWFDFECPCCERREDDFDLKGSAVGKWPKCHLCRVDMVKVQPAPGLAFKGPGWTPKHYGGKR